MTEERDMTADARTARAVEEAIQEHVAKRPARRVTFGRALMLGLVALSLYLVAPSVIEVFASWDSLSDVEPAWFAVVLVCQALSFICVFILQRLALRIKDWYLIATTQLAGNAFSRVVPGGAAAGAALQIRMLAAAGVDTPAAVSGLTAFSLLQTASVLALPVLVLPLIIGGARVHPGLVQSAVIGVVAFVVLAGIGVLLLTGDKALCAVARAAQAVRNRVVRKKPRVEGLPDRVLCERNAIRKVLGARWWEASLAIAGRLGFDYLSLLAAIEAVGTPKASLVLLAFSAATVLSMIPITPGGLGFVEAGLTAMLTLAGVPARHAVLATLVYRLFSYWLPIFVGPVAYAMFRRRYRRQVPVTA